MGCCFMKPLIPEPPQIRAIITPVNQPYYYEDIVYGQPYYPPSLSYIQQAPQPSAPYIDDWSEGQHHGII